jgi:hypothetical protein
LSIDFRYLNDARLETAFRSGSTSDEILVFRAGRPDRDRRAPADGARAAPTAAAAAFPHQPPAPANRSGQENVPPRSGFGKILSPKIGAAESDRFNFGDASDEN